jgi:NADPH:quinone reductase-like Zn-dependent oxidoreductase
MRAVIQRKYGRPERVLHVEEVDRPEPGPGQILVRVYASTVTRSDLGYSRPHPFFTRAFTGLLRPKRRTPGGEFAGVVAAAGEGVTEFRVGDEVFGTNEFFANAEYLRMRADGPVTHMPSGLSFQEAAAVPDGYIIGSTCIAWARVAEGQRVLVYGASGAIGTAGVQAAKARGAHVTAVCTAATMDLLKRLGADEVMDYRTTDFTKNGETYDVVFDAVGKHAYRRCRKSIKPGGIYLETDLGFMAHVLPLAILTKFVPPLFQRRRVYMPIPRYRKEEVVRVKELIEAGKYQPVIDRVFALDDIVQAHQYVASEQKVGSVVIAVAEEPAAARAATEAASLTQA